MMKLRLHVATIPGSEHVRLGKNNQDSFELGKLKFNQKDYLFGVVCDGCSAGKRSEAGAHLMACFICSEIPMIISAGVPLNEIAQALFIRCIGFLSAISAQTNMGTPGARAEFVRDYLFCTIMGFVMDEERVIFFSAGDGMFIVNDEITSINQDNTPAYLGYHLVDRSFLTTSNSMAPTQFLVSAYEMKDVSRFAICTDGMLPEAIEKLWGHYNDDLGVQRALKVLSRRKLIFSDDCTVITVEKFNPDQQGNIFELENPNLGSQGDENAER
jgi:hypothetical protein